MFKVVLILASIGTLFMTGCKGGELAGGPTSKIPERREFPINEKVNPCDNFFEYACSKANAAFKLREDRRRHTYSFSDSYERLLAKKKKYLKGLKSSSSKVSQRASQLRSLFKACTNTTARMAEEKMTVAKIKSTVGALKTKKALAQYITKMDEVGYASLISKGATNNLDNSDINDYWFMGSKLLSLPEKSYYDKKEVVADLKKLVTEFYTMNGFTNPSKLADDLINFERSYASVYPTPAKMRELYAKKIYSSKSKLKRLTSNLEIMPFLAKVPSNRKIRTPINSTLTHLNNAWKKTSLDNLKAFFTFYHADSVMDLAYPKYYSKWFAFKHKHLGGSPKRPELEERCTMEIMNSHKKEIDAELFDKIFPNFDTPKFVALLEKVRSSIIEGINKNTWLSKKAKAGALKKIRLAKFQVVKPMTEKEWDFNPPANYGSKKYLANKELLTKNLVAKDYKDLAEPVDKTKWWMGPLTVNAYYSPSDNKFVMPAGILQYPFYDPKLPDHVNLGAVGAVVGHELGHGIDDKGAQYDYKGRVNQWMPKKDVNNFKKRGAGLAKQFDEIGHNGKLTLGENIGDLVGVTFALNAAKKGFPKGKEDAATKGFFLQWARAWCGVTRPKEAERLLKVDPHAAKWARVNEQMKHQPDFHRVYQCKVGNKLFLPKDKIIKIW